MAFACSMVSLTVETKAALYWRVDWGITIKATSLCRYEKWVAGSSVESLIIRILTPRNSFNWYQANELTNRWWLKFPSYLAALATAYKELGYCSDCIK